LRCVVNVLDSYECILKHLEIELAPDMIELYLKKSRGNISKFLLLLENKKHNFIFEDFLKSRIDKFISTENNKELLSSISDTVSRIEVSGVRPESVCHELISICYTHFPTRNICEIIRMLSECQRKFTLSNKHSFLYEEMFINLIFQVR
jgi:predicted transcriptional regulator